ncbi:hypothetical protein [Methylobacterium persicinum]|uniref:DUF5666 domain-containing protein n=1 Tax=Methylobacterium persicinum TaxID=374426 RepID=A0ABU0HLP1_9HYPH|nr:hypothetical protein [Methylobacterium persicinum]MDQ0443235.1 hypothetical protein [Methylobacterium persicinum]GJE38189.1 hypothetical protein KHHGKMAE_2258 [Methylobacterium persicinum]
MNRILNRVLPVVVALVAGAPALAQSEKPDPSTHRFRGTVEARHGDDLVLVRPGGSTVTVQMGPKTQVYAAIGARLRDIKPESYITVIATPGTERAERVTLYSPSERGFAAGRQPWDTEPGATLTGGWISDVSGTEDRRVTLTYGEGHSAFAIPSDTPVTQVAPGEKALLVPGAPVTVFTNAGPDGAHEAGTVIVGRQGTVPTL